MPRTGTTRTREGDHSLRRRQDRPRRSPGSSEPVNARTVPCRSDRHHSRRHGNRPLRPLIQRRPEEHRMTERHVYKGVTDPNVKDRLVAIPNYPLTVSPHAETTPRTEGFRMGHRRGQVAAVEELS